jgi:ABC-type polysaccharide/polyol phosphate export permease
MQTHEEFYDSARHRSPLIDEVQALMRYNNLVVQFVSRSLKTRYKRSTLGVVWTLLNPILTMLVLTVVFSSLFRFNIEHYAVYILSGHTAWLFFSNATSASMGDMVLSGGLFQRIYVPKLVFPVASIGASLINLLISLIPLLLIAVFTGVRPTPALLVLPLSIVLLAAFALGLGLLLTTAAVYFADMLPVYEVLLTLWMYATPIIYPIEIIPPNLQWLFRLNPLYYFVRLFRAPIYDGVFPEWQAWLIGAGFALAALVVGATVFTSHTNDYAYRV